MFAVCLVAAMSLLSEPHSGAESRRAFVLLAVCISCLIITPQRLLVLAGGLAIISLRGLIGGVLYSSWKAFAIGGGAAACCLLIRNLREASLPYPVHDYSYAELLIDFAVITSALLLYSKFA